MKKLISIIVVALIFMSCNTNNQSDKQHSSPLADQVKQETLRSWNAYKKHAWGSDVLLPLSKGSKNWYEEPLYISPIDAYSTMRVMGLEEEAREIEQYVIDSLHFNKDIEVKVFEVNIRVLGGLLSMYQYTQNEKILAKAEDFGRRLLPAFKTGTGMPAYWVNLKTGSIRGDTINMAEAGTYLLEMGILSYFTGDPVFYQKAKKATMAAYNRRSEIGLIGERMDVQTGEWTNKNSHICAGIDSYYEYLYKAWLLFGDPDLKEAWGKSLAAIQKYIPEMHDSLLWYGRVNMETGEHVSSVVTLYDAFFPALLAISGNVEQARKLQHTWDWLWNQYGLEPMAYDYVKHQPTYPVYDLNPEIIESAYYLFHFTGDSAYFNMGTGYWNDILSYCKNDVAFNAIENVETKEKRDYMATYFFAETLKYFYLLFGGNGEFNFDDYIFTTEAHTFRRNLFDQNTAARRLGFEQKMDEE
ncbi:MAG: glycoside hydrolase family 47 protein [Bacteroidetes bacterium]|nr:glycoside hydrolase family 47 protein [Bacteroidota bacterium]